MAGHLLGVLEPSVVIFLKLIVPLRSLKLSDKMIKNFGDHSANERTFLAWVRTAIVVMAFGFLAEKFDLFLEFAAPSLAGRTLSLPGRNSATWQAWRLSFSALRW
jgi:hypothetical protein